LTVQIAVVASWTTTVNCRIAISDSTIEAVVIVLITDLVESVTLRILKTLSLTNIGISVTEIPNIAIIVVPTSTNVRAAITDRCRVLTVEIAVVAAFATTVVGATVSATEETVVVILIADLVESLALRVLRTGRVLAEVIAALVTVRTVVGVNTASFTLSLRAVRTEVRVVRGGQVAHSIKVVTLLVRGAGAGAGVGAGAVHVAVSSIALVTVRVLLTLATLGAGESTVDNIRPVTDWTQGVLERHVEGEGPLTQAAGVLV